VRLTDRKGASAVVKKSDPQPARLPATVPGSFGVADAQAVEAMVGVFEEHHDAVWLGTTIAGQEVCRYSMKLGTFRAS